MKFVLTIIAAFLLFTWLKTLLPEQLKQATVLVGIAIELVLYLIAFAPCYFVVHKFLSAETLNKDKD